MYIHSSVHLYIVQRILVPEMTDKETGGVECMYIISGTCQVEVRIPSRTAVAHCMHMEKSSRESHPSVFLFTVYQSNLNQAQRLRQYVRLVIAIYQLAGTNYRVRSTLYEGSRVVTHPQKYDATISETSYIALVW